MDVIFEIQSLDRFNNVAEELLTNLHSKNHISSTDIEPHMQDAAKGDIRKLLTNNNFNLDVLGESLQKKGWDSDKVESFVNILKKKKSELLYATLVNHHSEYGETIIDFDWSIKLVMGTSELKTLRYPLAQLTLVTLSADGKQSRIVYDMEKEMLGKFIKILENIDEIK